MPQDSKRKRHLRRIRRDRTLAYKMVGHLQQEREVSRQIIQGMAVRINELEATTLSDLAKVEATSGETVSE